MGNAIENKTQGSLMNSQSFYQPINVMSSFETSLKMFEDKVINNLEQSKMDVLNAN